VSSSAWIRNPCLVLVAPISSVTASWLVSGRPRQFMLMCANIRCSILFHLLVPGGRWQTVISSPVSRANRASSTFPKPGAVVVAAPAVGADQQSAGPAVGEAAFTQPPTTQRLNREAGGVVVDADAHPAAVAADVVDPVRNRIAPPWLRKSWTLTVSGRPLGCHSRPPLLNSPTSSFFLVSTESAGAPSA
jgi:hypothetical protein